MRRLARGDPARIPLRLQIVRVAAAHGQSPAAVRAWPADDLADAVNMLAVTGVRHGQ